MESTPSLPPEGEPLLTTGEVSRRLRVSINTVHRLAEQGEIKCYRVGRLRRFTVAAVDAYLEGAEHKPTTGRVSA